MWVRNLYTDQLYQNNANTFKKKPDIFDRLNILLNGILYHRKESLALQKVSVFFKLFVDAEMPFNKHRTL